MRVLYIYNPDEDNALRKISEVVSEDDFTSGKVKEIVQRLNDTLVFYGNGVGLSAIQIGYPLQIFSINCRPTESFSTMEQFSQTVINPVIKKLSSEIFDGREGCMSIADKDCKPQQRYQVNRSLSVTFDYTDENNIRHTDMKLTGIAAVVFQHEYDHLYGKLIDQTGIPGQMISQEEYLRRKNSGEKMVIS